MSRNDTTYLGVNIALATLLLLTVLYRVPIASALDEATSTPPDATSTEFVLPPADNFAIATTTLLTDVSTTTDTVSASSTTEVPTAEVMASSTETVVIAAASSTLDQITEDAPTTTPFEEAASFINQSLMTEDSIIIDRVTALEDRYFTKTGTYLQIIPGNTLPSYEDGTVTEKLGQSVPDNVRVDVYESPHGKGYQVTFLNGGMEYSSGKGPEASERSYTYSVADLTATTTEMSHKSETEDEEIAGLAPAIPSESDTPAVVIISASSTDSTVATSTPIES